MPIAADELVRAAVAIDLIDAATAEGLRAEARRRRADLLEVVTTRGRLPAAALYRAVAEQRGLPFLDATQLTPAADLIERLPRALLRRRVVLPVRNGEDEVLLVSSSPDEKAALETVARIAGKPVRLALAEPDPLRAAVEQALGDGGTAAETAAAAAAGAGAAGDPVGLLDRIMRDAILRRASDVHLEPRQDGMRARMRIDGRLHEYNARLSTAEGAGLVSRVKVLARLDIAEQRAPQDGGFTYEAPGAGRDDAAIDIRVATAPTRWGERATLRLLGIGTHELTLSSLGMPEDVLARFHEVIRRPWGMVLITGPTGGGKTTTLYAALREINRPDINVMTVEDPIEYVIGGIAQIQVAGEKVTFASALRSLLRHDPDVLMVGEIRDRETAGVALKAALTGHLVFSTIHTNNALGVITRLTDLGCEPYLVGGTLAAVIAQRLVRRLCTRCSRERPATPEETRVIRGKDAPSGDAAAEPPAVREPVGCAACLGTGFRGRVGLFELLFVDREIGRAISDGAGEDTLRDLTAGSLRTLRDDGIAKVLAGVTTLEEVLAVTVDA